VNFVFCRQILDASLHALPQNPEPVTVKPQVFGLPICLIKSRMAAGLAPVQD
jgi:hypothetical protein